MMSSDPDQEPELELEHQHPAPAGASPTAIEEEWLRLAFQSMDISNRYTFDQAMAIPSLAITIRLTRERIKRRRAADAMKGEDQ